MSGLIDLLHSKAKEWLEWDPNSLTRQEIQVLLENEKWDILEQKLMKRISFGTAGLRSCMSSGYNSMNDLVILQTTQGLCQYMKECFTDTLNCGIVIGYDHREMPLLNLSSSNFALLASYVFISQNIPVYYFNKFIPTPLVPFAIEKLNCIGGIMITASHNPKNDNGYKLYWENGCQIISPHDEKISNYIMKNLQPWDNNYAKFHVETTVQSSAIYNDVTEAMIKEYMKSITMQLCHHSESNNKSDVRIAYTAMHGVGHAYMKLAFEHFQHNPYYPVDSQLLPNPDFPTVPFPNPEEKGALDEAMRVATMTGCSIVLANDPDADRLALAEYNNSDKTWKVFTGNELAILLGSWKLHEYIEKCGRKNLNNVYMIGSIVSTQMLKGIAETEGFQYIQTLTGFKYIGNKADQLLKEGKTILFSFEEAIGYCIENIVKDKDGISAGVVATEMINQIYLKGNTLSMYLDELYCKYGYYISNNYYVRIEEPMKIKRVFNRLRNGEKYGLPLGNNKVTSLVDVTKGYDSTKPDYISDLPVTPSSEMIMFALESGCRVILRTSGTEPKLKYYIEYKSDLMKESRDSAREKLNKVAEIVKEVITLNDEA